MLWDSFPIEFCSDIHNKCGVVFSCVFMNERPRINHKIRMWHSQHNDIKFGTNRFGVEAETWRMITEVGDWIYDLQSVGNGFKFLRQLKCF